MKMARILLLTLIVLTLAAPGQAAVLNFDDIPTATFTPLSNGYGGLNWTDMNVVHASAYAPAYVGGLASAPNVAYNTVGPAAAPAISTISGYMDFAGANFAGAYNNGLQIDLVGWRDGTQIYSTTITTSYYHPTWFDFDWTGIDKLTLSSYGGDDVQLPGYSFRTQFVMDNFAYTESMAATPIPGAIWLLGSGVLGLAGIRRRRKHPAS